MKKLSCSPGCFARLFLQSREVHFMASVWLFFGLFVFKPDSSGEKKKSKRSPPFFILKPLRFWRMKSIKTNLLCSFRVWGILSVVAVVVKMKVGLLPISFCWSFLRWLYWVILLQISYKWLISKKADWRLVLNFSVPKSFYW